jgi:ribonuclease J
VKPKQASVTLYGGVGEVGGNIVYIHDAKSNSHILFDLGRSFRQQAKFYSWPDKPSRSVEVELIKTEILPIIKTPAGNEIDYYARLQCEEILVPYGVRGKQIPAKHKTETKYKIIEPKVESPITDVFVSHSHSDHVGLVTLLRRDIKITLSRVARAFFQGFHEVVNKDSLETKMYLTEECLNAKEREELTPRHEYNDFSVSRYGKAFEIPRTNTDLDVYAHPVDHSIPGADGYIADTSAGPIVYTGDFRTHGKARILTTKFVEAVKEFTPIKILICEGTNLGEAKVFSEDDVKKCATDITKKSLQLGNRLVLVEVLQANIDRVRTFCEIAREHNFVPLVTLRLANYLHALSRIEAHFDLAGAPLPLLGDHSNDYKRGYSLGIFVRRRHPAWRSKVFRKLEDAYGEFMIESKQVVSETKTGTRKYLIIDTGEIDIIDLKPPPGTICILSTSEPFTEESEFDFERWKQQLALFGVILYHIHASGHVHPLELLRVIREINPEIVIPIHTEYPDVFREILVGTNIKVHIPKRGVPIEI